MQREIKFRGFSVEKKKMYNPAFPTWNGGVEVWRNNKPQTTTECYYSQNGPADQMILTQFIGLKDINGVEIYEGDIMIFDDNDGLSECWEGTVEFEQYGWQCNDRYESNCMWIEDLQNNNVVEGMVIGNIYEEVQSE